MTRNVGRSRDLSISETFFTALSNPETHSSFCKHAMQNYSPLASYAIVEKGEAGWRVELLKVPSLRARARCGTSPTSKPRRLGEMDIYRPGRRLGP
jgi:hypothetical protein